MSSFQEYLSHGNAWLYIPAGIVLGALHGLEPGHSKTMMAAFIISVRGTVAQAALLGLCATVSHTAIIWVLAYVGLTYSKQLNVHELEPYFQVAAGIIVIGMAGWMFWRIHREQIVAAAHEHHEHDHGPHGGTMINTGHGLLEISVFETGVPPRFRLYFFDAAMKPVTQPSNQTLTLETIRPDGARQIFQFNRAGEYLEATENLPEPHEFSVTLTLTHDDHAHTYETKFVEDHDHSDLPQRTAAEYEDAHQRAHAADLYKRFSTRHVTTGQIVLFGLTGGLMPCPAAFTVLVVCLQLKQFTLGFALVLAFSIGLAITLVTVGSLAALSVREAGKRLKNFGNLARKLPYASAGVMALIGLLVAAQGLKHLMR